MKKREDKGEESVRRTTAGEKGEEETGERGEPVAVEGRGNSTAY